MNILLVHGWSYDRHLWDNVVARLDDHRLFRVDFGYTGEPEFPDVPANEPLLAVGHSLGALWLLTQQHYAWARLLAINGFPRFTETDNYAPAVGPRALARMQTQLAKDPLRVLADFHARCGGSAPEGEPQLERLAEGLHWLADLDGRAALAARSNDIWALAGADDAIVPRAMSEAAFAGLPPGHLEIVDTPGHLLPLTDPAHCAAWIARLATI